MAHKTRVVMIYGYYGNPKEGWFPYLKSELEKQNIQVVVPTLPSPTNPKLDKWVEKIHETVGTPDDDTYLVGHSLGSISILRYLESLTDNVKVGGVLLVAGFARPIKTHPELDHFTTKPLDPEAIKLRVEKIVLINSDNDPYVPLEEGKYMQKALGGKLLIYPDGYHLNEDKGFTELPEARDELLKLIGG